MEALSARMVRALDGADGSPSPMGTLAREVELGTRLNDHLTRLDALETRMGSAEARLDSAEARLDALEAQVFRDVVTVTADHTLLVSDGLVVVDGAFVTVTLYDPTLATFYTTHQIKLLGAGRVDFSRDVDGGSYAVTDPGQCVTLTPTPDGWVIV